MNLEKIFASLILSVGIFLSGFFIAKSLHFFRDFERSVKVKGLDEKTVKADMAILTITFTQTNPQLNELYKSFSSSQSRILEFLVSKGIKSTEIEKNAMDITESRTSLPKILQPIVSYSGVSKVIISSSDVDGIKSLSQNTGGLVEKGVLITSTDVKFLFTQLNTVKKEMLDQAVKNAFEAASSFATQTKSKLGQIRNASQGLFSISDANSTEEWMTTKSIQKKVRVVVAVDYFLE